MDDVCYPIEEMNDVCCYDALEKIREKDINGRGIGRLIIIWCLLDKFYWNQKKNTNIFSYRVWNENKWNFLPFNEE